MHSVLAALAALIVAISGVVFANLDQTPQQDRSSSQSRSSLCRLEIAGSAWCAAFEARLKALHDLLGGLKKDAEEQTIHPSAPSPPSEPSQTEPAQQPDGCTTEKSSGPGWSQTTVRCSQESTRTDGTGNRIVVSSSSVNVSSTNSDDEP
jgi:hypothetical protein